MNDARRFRVSRSVYMAVVALTLLGISLGALADTYNFYFTKPKKQQGNNGQASPSNDDEQESEDSQAPASAPSPTRSAPQVSTSPQGGGLVINNNNNIAMPPPSIVNNNNNNNNNLAATPAAPQAPAPLAPPASSFAPPSSSAPSAVTAATVQLPSEERHPWRFGVSGVLTRESYTASSYDYTYNGSGSSSYTPSTYQTSTTGAGGLVSLGYEFSPYFDVNLYGGLKAAATAPYFAGLDAEFLPIRISVGSLDIFQLGILVGGSTLSAASGNIGSLHGGARVLVNFSKQIGITGAARANLGHLMFEAGVVTRL